MLFRSHWKNKWPVFDRENMDKLNMYSFSKKLSDISKDATVVTDVGSAYYVMAQSLINNKLLLPAAQGEMGFALPASIGVAISESNNNVI